MTATVKRKKSKAQKTPVSINVPDDLLEQVKRVCALTGGTGVSNFFALAARALLQSDVYKNLLDDGIPQDPKSLVRPTRGSSAFDFIPRHEGSGSRSGGKKIPR